MSSFRVVSDSENFAPHSRLNVGTCMAMLCGRGLAVGDENSVCRPVRKKRCEKFGVKEFNFLMAHYPNERVSTIGDGISCVGKRCHPGSATLVVATQNEGLEILSPKYLCVSENVNVSKSYIVVIRVGKFTLYSTGQFQF